MSPQQGSINPEDYFKTRTKDEKSHFASKIKLYLTEYAQTKVFK